MGGNFPLDTYENTLFSCLRSVWYDLENFSYDEAKDMVLSPSRQSKQLKKPSKLQCFNDLA
jgi:hypothetical protein